MSTPISAITHLGSTPRYAGEGHQPVQLAIEGGDPPVEIVDV